jgi:type I restriction enzyme S subunit
MYVECDFWPLNTTLWVKEFKVGSPLYAFYVLQSIDLAGYNSGAAVPTLNRNDVHGFLVLKPTPNVLLHFDAIAGPMLTLKRRLEQKNANLRTARDLLLPKLISGELDVSTLPEPEEAIAA